MGKLEDLKLHQQWRLGEIEEQPLTAKETTEAIDYAIKALEEDSKAKEQLEFSRQVTLALISSDEFIKRLSSKYVIANALTEEINKVLDKLNKSEYLKGGNNEN